jgi:hypothetical protein
MLRHESRKLPIEQAAPTQELQRLLDFPHRMVIGIGTRVLVTPVDDVANEEVEIDVQHPLHHREPTKLVAPTLSRPSARKGLRCRFATAR